MAIKLTGDISEIVNIATKLQKFGTVRNIVSVFDDGGYRELLLATLFNLTLHKGRHGDDASDEETHRYELKTVNLVDTSGKLRRKPGITTCHHVNFDIINRYRNVNWLIGIFFVNEPVEIYEVTPEKLKSFFDSWENRLKEEKINHINNPKLPFDFIRQNGTKHFENKDLVKKYIEGTITPGTEVFKDIISIRETIVTSEDNKVKASTEGI